MISQDLDLCELILSFGASVSCADHDGWCALHEAARWGDALSLGDTGEGGKRPRERYYMYYRTCVFHGISCVFFRGFKVLSESGGAKVFSVSYHLKQTKKKSAVFFQVTLTQNGGHQQPLERSNQNPPILGSLAMA